MYEKDYHSRDISPFTFLVTGGAGFIGSHIVEYLMRKGAARVRVLDNLSTGSIENLAVYESDARFEMMEGDIRDLATCTRAMEDVDYVLHQAALGSVPRSINDPIRTNDVNVSGFLNVLVAARDSNIKQMVYAASSSTYGDNTALPKVEEHIGKPLSPYAVTKYINELYASVFSRTYQFHTIGLRYFNVFGPRQNPRGPYAAVIPLFIKAALNEEPASINGDGETGRDFTFVENVVQANIRALFSSPEKHEVVNVACGNMITLNNLWKMICRNLGVTVPAHHGPDRTGDIKHSLASISKAGELFGYRPDIGIEEGLNITIDWARENVEML